MARKASPISMEHVILALLDEEPMHGYELHQRLSNLAGITKIWNLKQALFYAKLERLHSDGYITELNLPTDGINPARVVFQLSTKGKTALSGWITSPVRKARDIQQVFLSKLIIARRYGLHKALELIHNQKVVSQSWLQHLEAEIPDSSPENLDDYLVHRYKMSRDHATLNWLDGLEAQLLEAEKHSKL